MDHEKQILFYENKYYMFSNFSSFSVEKDGFLWSTSEHLYQASKFMDSDSKINIVEEIRSSRSAHDSKKIAEKYLNRIRKDWDDIKIGVMEEIILLKHDQHKYIQRKLLESTGREIVENSPIDSFWGWGPNHDGQNELGKVWMRLREEILKKQQAS